MKNIKQKTIIVLVAVGLISCVYSCKKPSAPTVTTKSVTEVTASSAKSGGNVTSDGGEEVTVRGVCWSTSNNPTTADDKVVSGSGTGEFTCDITGLDDNTQYFVRAYAVNSEGTSYGESLPFTTEQVRTVTDNDGNVYNTIYIGEQVWMKENLKTTTYNDDEPISNITDPDEWSQLTEGAYCWYQNRDTYRDVYGGLYNWYAVNTGKLCPDGWHVPTDEEWHQMALNLDASAVLDQAESLTAGGMLKETGTDHWADPNTGATNETDFTALPGGYRNFDGAFSGVTGNANFRTSTVFDDGFAWVRYMMYQSGTLYRDKGNHEGGFSVRCVKD